MDDLELLAAHLADLKHLGYRPGTINARRWAVLRVHRHCGISTADHDRLYDLVSRPTMGADARANLISHIRAFYRWVTSQGFLEGNPADNLQRPRRPRRLPRPMPELSLRRAIKAADEPIRSWLHLAAYGGLRCCEIAPLKGEDRMGDLLVIQVQKGGDPGVVPIGQVLDRAIAHLPRAGWWFERWDGQGGPISAGQLQHHANRFLHDLGIEHTMHTLRHRYGSQVHAITGDLRVTQELMRHRSILSTVLYTEIDQARGAKVVAQLA